MKLALIVLLMIVFFYLARASYALVTQKDKGKTMAQHLSWRIGLSLLIFALLMLGFFMGWLQPHSLLQ